MVHLWVTPVVVWQEKLLRLAVGVVERGVREGGPGPPHRQPEQLLLSCLRRLRPCRLHRAWVRASAR